MLLRSHTLKKDYELPQGSTIVGRITKCQIVLTSDSVSKQQAEIRVKGDQVMIRDLDSHNGTLVNQRDIKGLGWVELFADDRIYICGFDFRLERGKACNSSGECIVDPGRSDSDLSGSHSISLSNRRLSEVPQFSQLRALLEITRTLRDVLRIEDVLARSSAMLLHIFPAVERAAIGYVHDDGSFEPKWWQLRDRNPQGVIRISQTIVRHVAATAQAIIIQDAWRDYEEANSVMALPMRSVMVAPLLNADDQVCGLIHLDASRPNKFTDFDLEVLAAVAVQLSLAINFARLHATAMEDALLRRDVEQARAVQQKYLPTSSPQIDGYDLAGFYRAARHVGGDYFDYIPLPDGRLAIVLGDVVGKGVPAALTMVRLATETRTSLEVCQTASEVVTRLNLKLHSDFITLVFLILDPATNRVTVSNAGHDLPLLRTAEGEVRSVGADSSGCPLSVLDDEQYAETTIQLAPGDRLVLFSDGFPDAVAAGAHQRFGKQPIVKILQAFRGDAAGLIEEMVDQVDRFVDGGPQFDDMCMVCLRRESALKK